MNGTFYEKMHICRYIWQQKLFQNGRQQPSKARCGQRNYKPTNTTENEIF